VQPLAYLLLAYALTLPAPLIAHQVESSSDLVAWLKLAALVAFAWHAFVLWRRRAADRASRLALSLAIGLMWWAFGAMYVYKVITAMPFSFGLATASFSDSWRTLVLILGTAGTVAMLAAVAAFVGLTIPAAGLVLRRIDRFVRARAMRSAVALACVGALAYLIGADARYIAYELVLYPRHWARDYPFAKADFSALQVRSDESVFIVQLESVNSYALFSRSGRGFQPRIPLPGLATLLREGGGVLFPRFLANGRQTHHAMEAIVCGISGNTGKPVASDLTRLTGRKCLPEQLDAAGYATMFFYANFDIDFSNKGAFMRRAGFAAEAFGEPLMGKDAPRFDWGYDDCAFYERSFDYLQAQGLAQRKRLLAFFEATANHFPFWYTQKHPQAHPHRSPDTPLEHYQNALAEQDHCLLAFWRRLRALGRDDIHVFVVPDHSWLTGHLPQESRFATFLAYVPPARRRSEFEPGMRVTPVPSQAQIYPTVLELLGAGRTPQSFAFALRGAPRPSRYQDCQLLADPFDNALIAVHDGKPVKLDLREGDFWTFRDRYFCR
jgi:hypothetical protein